MGSGVDYLVMGAAVLFDLPLWVLFISRTLSGTTSAAFCMAYAYVADVSEPQRRSQNFGLLVLAHTHTHVWSASHTTHTHAHDTTHDTQSCCGGGYRRARRWMVGRMTSKKRLASSLGLE